MNKFFFWNHFLKKPPSRILLGKILEEMRYQQGLSICQAAHKAQLQESIIEALEKSDFFQQENRAKPYMLSHRLDAIRYARVLGLEREKIQKFLPPLPSLNPAGTTLLNNLATIGNKNPAQASFWKRQLKSLYIKQPSKKARRVSGKTITLMLKVVIIMIVFLFLWKEIRYFKRVIWNDGSQIVD